MRQALKGTLHRWERAGAALPCERCGAQKVVAMARVHGSESFYGFTDPEEAAIFSAFVEIIRVLEDPGVDP